MLPADLDKIPALPIIPPGMFAKQTFRDLLIFDGTIHFDFSFREPFRALFFLSLTHRNGMGEVERNPC
jgi:hypothetical protein